MRAWLKSPTRRRGRIAAAVCQTHCRPGLAGGRRAGRTAGTAPAGCWLRRWAAGGRRPATGWRRPCSGPRRAGLARAAGSSRKLAVVFGHQDPRRLVEMPGPAIVAQPFPEPQHVLFVGISQLAHRGKCLEEVLEIGHHRGDLRLLQHHLADPDAIGIAVFPPGQVAAPAPEPFEQSLGFEGAESRKSRVEGRTRCFSGSRLSTLGSRLTFHERGRRRYLSRMDLAAEVVSLSATGFCGGR